MMVNKQKWLLRALGAGATLGFFLMFASIIHAFISGDLSIEGPQLANMPWGIVSLVDIYLGLLLFSIWILWRENFGPAGLAWFLLVVVLGNLLSCMYILKALREARGDVQKFWLGKHASREAGDV